MFAVLACSIVLGCVGCGGEHDTGESRFFYAPPAGPSVQVIERVSTTTAFDDAAICDADELTTFLKESGLDSQLTHALNPQSACYFFAWIPYTESPDEVRMEFVYIEGESSSHLFHVHGGAGDHTGNYVLFVWAAEREVPASSRRDVL
jgi:hypothetical protein